MKHVFKKSFTTNYPFIWAFVVFIGVEFSFFIFDRAGYLSNFKEEKLLFIIALLVKLLIFILLAFGFKKFSDIKLNS